MMESSEVSESHCDTSGSMDLESRHGSEEHILFESPNNSQDMKQSLIFLKATLKMFVSSVKSSQVHDFLKQRPTL